MCAGLLALSLLHGGGGSNNADVAWPSKGKPGVDEDDEGRRAFWWPDRRVALGQFDRELVDEARGELRSERPNSPGKSLRQLIGLGIERFRPHRCPHERQKSLICSKKWANVASNDDRRRQVRTRLLGRAFSVF
jgi:hypothetical protein